MKSSKNIMDFQCQCRRDFMWIPIDKEVINETKIDNVTYVVKSIYTGEKMIFDKIEDMLKNDFKSLELLKKSGEDRENQI